MIRYWPEFLLDRTRLQSLLSAMILVGLRVGGMLWH